MAVSSEGIRYKMIDGIQTLVSGSPVLLPSAVMSYSGPRVSCSVPAFTVDGSESTRAPSHTTTGLISAGKRGHCTTTRPAIVLLARPTIKLRIPRSLTLCHYVYTRTNLREEAPPGSNQAMGPGLCCGVSSRGCKLPRLRTHRVRSPGRA